MGDLGWALPAALEEVDERLVRGFDAAVAAGELAAGCRLACRLGCTACCIGPFDITPLDAARLLRGMEALDDKRPAVAEAIRRRAGVQWEEVAGRFPGNAAARTFSGENAAGQALFDHFMELPCPALDPATGACELYAFRPLSCRSFGLPVRCGKALLPPCSLNSIGAVPAEVAAALIEPDPDDAEGRLLEEWGRVGGVGGDTIVAAVPSLGRRRS
jgi:Fe-S-cluster containining protein